MNFGVMTGRKIIGACMLLCLAFIMCQTPTMVQAQTSQTKAQDKPFAVEYYYKVKWGFANEFIRLYKKNHHPLLKKQIEEGRIIQLKTETPFYHAGEETRWDYRVTIVWKNSVVAHDDYDDSVISKKLFTDQETFRREEQRRFEILISHWDVAVIPVDMDKP